MPALHDLQSRLRDALVSGRSADLASALGGTRAASRLQVHRRHYTASLVRALLDRFPASTWLTGTPWMTEAALTFVREHPPTRPCIAEYGDALPAFLERQPGAATMPYLGQFAELEWHVGRLALAVDGVPLTMADLPVRDVALGEAVLDLQPDLHYVAAGWAVDELLAVYLSTDAPKRFLLRRGDVWLEVRGARGDLRIQRLTHADYTFRAALAAHAPLADAGLAAFEIQPSFDAGRALIDVVLAGLVVGLRGSEGA